MRRLYTWFAGVVGGAAVYRAFRRRPGTLAEPEAREAGDDRESFEAGETPVDQADVAPGTGDLDTRRRSVHEQARATIDEMQGD